MDEYRLTLTVTADPVAAQSASSDERMIPLGAVCRGKGQYELDTRVNKPAVNIPPVYCIADDEKESMYTHKMFYKASLINVLFYRE